MKLTGAILEGFVKTLLLPKFDGAAPVPECHREWWDACCSDYKFVAIAAPRGSAKSTAITHAYTLAKVVFREAKFVIIVSDTEAQSILFLNDLKKEMMENEDLRALFGIKELIKDAETDIIVEFNDGHQARLMAKGSEQKLRGLKWNHSRPDLIICDDMENDELVMNRDRRIKFQRWFSSALLPVRSDKGIIRIVGTILHTDSLLASFMPKERDKDTRQRHLKTYSVKPSSWLALKYKAHDADYSHLLWAEKQTEQDLKAIRQIYELKGQLDLYSQEYLNNPIDESNQHFRKSDLLAMTDADMERRLVYYITSDLAVTIKQTSDHSVFIVWGVDSDGYVHVKHLVRGRMDALEIADTYFMLVKLYDPVMVVTEKGAIANSILPGLLKKMDDDNLYFRFELLPSNVDKLQRSQAIRLRARAGKVKINKKADWYDAFEEELLRFPRSEQDDQVDAFSLIGQTLNKFYEAPTDEEAAKEEEDEDFVKSGFYNEGREEQTGY